MQENSTRPNANLEVISLIFQLLVSSIIVGSCLALLHGCQDSGLQPVLCPVLVKPCFVNTQERSVTFNEEGVEFIAGSCKSGVSYCSVLDGSFSSCVGYVNQREESCNELDDDCDGLTDNVKEDRGSVCVAGLGECATGYWTCSDGAPLCASATEPSEETCDGRDNDCDGNTDEGIVRACYSGPTNSLGVGVCAPGYTICFGGKWTECLGEITPSVEVACNAEDEDCDGSSTDANKCRCGEGPTAEICNGIDDDCDGLTDEDVTNACGFCGDVEEEPCNGYDDDCDGTTDEDSAPFKVVIAIDTSGSMGGRLAVARAGLENAITSLELDCPCNSYTVVKFPFSDADWAVLTQDAEAWTAANVISMIALGGGAIEVSYDVIANFTTEEVTMVLVADEGGQSMYYLTEKSLSIGSSSLLTFSDDIADYDELGKVEELKDGSTVESVTKGFLGDACNP